MAFFSDGNKEYFSLSLCPNKNKNKKSYVYKMNKKQEMISKNFIHPLLIISSAIFITIIIISIIEFFNITAAPIMRSNQQSVVLALAVMATLIAFFEILIFLWIRNGQKNITKEFEVKKDRSPLVIIRKKSCMAYAIFLFCMLSPFIGILALPGGVLSFTTEISMYGPYFSIFLFQIIIFLIILSVFLILRIKFLLFLKDNSVKLDN